MDTGNSNSEMPCPPAEPSRPPKSKRVLACVRCQRRKIKCDHRTPCSHCRTLRVPCVPATPAVLTTQRRRRFPERELLQRIRMYEDLLEQNNIKFEPLHKEFSDRKSLQQQIHTTDDSEQNHPGNGCKNLPSLPIARKEADVFEAKSLIQSLAPAAENFEDSSQVSNDGEIHDMLSKRGWEPSSSGSVNHLFFGSSEVEADLSSLHPKPAHILKLWQLYLENVGPLLGVTHNTSLQGHIINAVGDVQNIKPSLEALMFSIYCMSSIILTEDECEEFFSSPKADLLSRFRFGCQQALLKCGFLQTKDRDCLTALFLYLVSVATDAGVRSVSSMFAVAIRIGQRMRLHNEAALATHTVFEAEMRRRLWWALVLFDSRISEMSDHKCTTLNPTWDCKVPLNINDSDLRPEMKELPVTRETLTDATFIAVRGELGNFIRHAKFHLDFTTPALKPIINTARHGTISSVTKLDLLQKRIEDRYLSHCDPENAVHFLTLWFTQLVIARCRLIELYSRCNQSKTESQRDAALHYSLKMLECDTKIAASPSARRLMWMPDLYFPFIAYISVLEDLRRRPTNKQAERAWEAISLNFETHMIVLYQDTAFEENSQFVQTFTRIILLAWETREAAFKNAQKPLTPPRIVSLLRERETKELKNTDTAVLNSNFDIEMESFLTLDTTDFYTSDPLQLIGEHGEYVGTGLEAFSNSFGPSSFAFE